MNALILSAGLGERLKPITDSIPKPLLPVVGRRLIDINIDHLMRNGIQQIGINLFHRHQMIKEHLDKYGDRIDMKIETELLGTGGALLNFPDLVKDDFVLYSGDVVSDVKLNEVVKYHTEHDAVATLVLTKYKGIEFEIGKDNRIERIHWGEGRGLTYAGIAILSPRVCSFLPQERVFSIVDVFKNLVRNGEKIVGLPSVMRWYNINAHHDYWKIHHDLLLGTTGFENLRFNSPFHVADTSKVSTDSLAGFVSINERCTVDEGVYLENTIVLPNTWIAKGNYRNSIISSDLRVTAA
jgi:NDP-sugar pyrophosphorylase family protein